MKKFLILLLLVFLFFPIIALSESVNKVCSVSVQDRGERDRIMIKLDNLELPKGTKLKVYSGMRDSKTPIKVVYIGENGIDFEIPNYAKNGKFTIVEHIKFKLPDGSGLNFDPDNQWVYFAVNSDGTISPVIGIVMFKGFPTMPLKSIEKEKDLLKLGEHPELE